MTDGDTRHRIPWLRGLPADDDAADAWADDSGGTEYRPFASFRGPQTAFMLEFRLTSGERVAFGYHWLQRLDLDGPQLVLDYGRSVVAVTGRHLGSLFAAVAGHRARWVWAADRPTALLVPETEPLVTDILIRDV